MATLHFICGKAASGETTLARKLAACHGAALFCEGEWLVPLQAQIASLADYVEHTRRLRAALAPHATQLLRIDTVIESPRRTAAAHEHRIREPRLRGQCGEIIFGDIETPELDIASLLGASQDRLPAHQEWPACRKPDLRD